MPLLYVALCALVGLLGRNRFLGFWGFFVISLLLTPLVTAIALVVTIPKAAPKTVDVS